MRAVTCLLLCGPALAAEPVTCINLDPSSLPELTAAAVEAGLLLTHGEPTRPSRVVLVQADKGGVRIDAALAARLDEHVRGGGALLLTLSQQPGVDAFRCATFLPTTAWQTLMPEAYRGGTADAVRFGLADDTFFPAAPQGALAWHWRLKPLHAAEKGEQRYERLARTQAYVNLPRAAGEGFLSRSILNRDWRIRLDADDVRHDGLLITGRYGAGRVAVWAADAAQGDRMVWGATLRWLAAPRPAAIAVPADVVPTVRIDADTRRLVVAARNRGGQALTLPVVARIAGWDGTPVGDSLAELVLPAGGGGEAAIVLPAPDATSARILADRDVLRVRLGVLAPDGSRALLEQTIVADFRPQLRAELSADELRSRPRPFTAPGPESLKLPQRGGTPVSTYAVKPGAEVGIDLRLGNGITDLAPLAAVVDLTPGADQDDVVALHDEASGRMGPRDSYRYWGAWRGIEKIDNVLEFSFAEAVTIAAVVLDGDVAEAGKPSPNPGALSVACDGAAVGAADDLDQRFAAGRGLVRLDLATPVTGRVFRIVLPWREGQRAAPVLGEIELHGWRGERPAARTTAVELRLLAPGREPEVVLRQQVEVAGGSVRSLHAEVRPPASGAIGACRVEAVVDGAVAASLPLLAIDPPRPLQPTAELVPKGKAIAFPAIVTRGLRTFCAFGGGSRDTKGSWGEPEDLAFAYARGLKQTAAGAKCQAGRMYLSEHDFRHYVTGWTSFCSGEPFLPTMVPELIARVQGGEAWKQAEVVHWSFSDRWDTGPSVDNLWTWQEMVAFDRWLGAQGLPRLTPGPREVVSREIYVKRRSQFRAWQLARYLASVAALCAPGEAAGKRTVLTAQGTPLVPLSALPRLAGTIQAMTDDNTWGAIDEDLPRTAARQMANLAFNPSWRMGSTFVWGWDNAIFNNPHWFCPVGTTETSRRHQAIRAWRSVIDLDGTYKPMFHFGYSMNGYAPWFTSRADWQENWNAAERGSLIAADGPIGCGVVVSTGAFDDPARTVFSGGGMGDSKEADRIADGAARLIGLLHHAGASVPFAANVTAAGRWQGRAPLVLADLAGFTAAERAQVAAWAGQGVALVAFSGGKPLGDLAADFAGEDSGVVIAGRPVLASGNRLLVDAAIESLSLPEARDLVRLMQRRIGLGIAYPRGCAGYGFTMAGRRFVTVEDWLEQGREVAIRLRAVGSRASAIGLGEHRILDVRRDGGDWVITLPIRAGDGDLIMVEEQ